MGTIIVTGGAGFIGSDFVRHALAAHRGSRRRARRADLRRQPREPGRRRVAPALRLRPGRHRGSRDRAPRSSATSGRRPSSTSRPRRTSTARSTTRRASCARTWSAPSSCSRPPGSTLRENPDLAGAFRFLHVSTDEVYGTLGRRGPLLRDDALRPELALRGVEGRRRPPRPRVARDLPAAGPDHELLQQLRALPVPGEADPAHDPERRRGPEAADLRRRRERARLAVRGGPLRGDPARAAAGAPGREVQHRRRQRADQPAGRRRPVRGARGRAARAREPRPAGAGARLVRRAQDLRRRSPRPRPPLRDRREPDPLASWAGSRATPSRAASPRRCAGISPTAPGARRCSGASTTGSGSVSEPRRCRIMRSCAS